MNINDKQIPSDSVEIKQRYYYWRFRILYSVVIGYTFFYFVRKNISIAMPGIEADLGISKTNLGLFLTLSGLAYGVSKFVNGIWGDRANPRYFMPAGLLLSALMSVFFGMSSAVIVFGIIWLLNGWFQGMGCPPCVKSIGNWFSPSERGVRFSIWGTSQSIGAAFVVVLGGFLAAYSWRLCFFVPAGLAIAGAIFLFNRLRDTPESLGLPSVEEMHGEKPEIDHGKEEMTKKEFKRFLIRQVFANPGMWVLCFASFFLYTIRYAIFDWGPTFLKEVNGITLRNAGILVASYEVSGIVGMLIAGWLSDKIFKGRGSRVCVIYMLACTALVFLFWKLSMKSNIGNAILLCGIGFTIYGPQILVGVEGVNVATKKAASTAVGLIGLFSYLSGTISGWGVGYIVDHYSWNAAFLMLIVVGLLATLMFSVTAIWNFNHRH